MTQQHFSSLFHKRYFFLILLAINFFCLLAYFSNVGFTQNAAESDALRKDIPQSNNAQTDETPPVRFTPCGAVSMLNFC
jgi:hypothetical protein